MDIRMTVPVYEWMREPALLKAFEVLGQDNALMVGGCVRNAVLGVDLPIEEIDIDIATKLTPDEVMRRFEDACIKVIPTGLSHGTISVIVEGKVLEITTLRRDVATDGRHAEVIFTKNYEEDALRRDFTMNTLLMCVNGRLYDPTGRGVDDLLNGKVVFVGDADARIAEDYLRILRFFRFHARYGVGAPDGVGMQACLRAKFHISKLSRERVTQEYEKLLPVRGAGDVLLLLRDFCILPDLISARFNRDEYMRLQSLGCIMGKKQLIKLLFAYSVWWNKGDSEYSLLAKYFVLSNDFKKFLKSFFSLLNQPFELFAQNAYVFGKDVALAGLVFSYVINDLDSDFEGFLVRYKAHEKQENCVFPVSGNDVAVITGKSQGPELGAVLKSVESWWLLNGMVASREELITKIKEFA